MQNNSLDLKKKGKGFLRWLLFIIAIILLLILVAITLFSIQRVLRETENFDESAPKSGHFVQTSDAKIFVQEKGAVNRPTVLLIHGTGTWSEIWRETIEPLANQGFHVVAIDLPPFGYSEKLRGSQSYTRQAQAKRIIEVLDGLNIGRAILVGHSVGARPTLEAALQAPQRVAKLVLVDPALGFPSRQENNPNFVQNNPPWLLKAFFRFEALRDIVISIYGTNPMFIDKLLRSFVSNKNAITSERVEIVKQPMSVHDTTRAYGDWLENLTIDKDTSVGSDFANLKKLKIPVNVIWGSTDTITPLWQGQKLVELIPEAQLSVINGVGHIPYIENVKEFNSTLVDVLR